MDFGHNRSLRSQQQQVDPFGLSLILLGMSVSAFGVYSIMNHVILAELWKASYLDSEFTMLF